MNSFPIDAPRSLPMPQLWQQGALIVIAVALALCIAYALWRLIRQRDRLFWLGIRDRQGWARWPLAVLIPVAGVAVHTGVSAPIYMGLNSMNSATDNILPGLMTIAFSLVMLSVFQRWVVREQPAGATQRATARDARAPAMRAATS